MGESVYWTSRKGLAEALPHLASMGAGEYWDARAAQCRQALKLLRQARPKVLPGSRNELEYVIFKTENFIKYFEVLRACHDAKVALDRAWLAKIIADTPSFWKHLEQCRAAVDRADRLARGQTVVIVGDRIAKVGPSDSICALPNDARVIEAKGKFVVPGLIDGHVHLTFPLNRAHVTGDEILPLFLAAGVTAVRSTGDEVVAATGVAHFAASHPDICPRVFTASPLFDAHPPTHPEICIPVTNPAQVPEIVANMVAWKVSTLKIYARLSPPVASEVVREGHRRGLMITAHLANDYSA